MDRAPGAIRVLPVVGEMAAEEQAVVLVDPMDHAELDPLMILRHPEKL